MNKKYFAAIITVVIIISAAIFIWKKSGDVNIGPADGLGQVEQPSNEKGALIMHIKINDNLLEAKMADTAAARALAEKLQNENVLVQAKEYGGFEKVGDLGFALPESNQKITTNPGDIVLYQGNQISIFYGENTWSYTTLGHIDLPRDELARILGSDDVVIEITK